MKEYYKLSVAVTGLKRRDRKVKFHSLSIGHLNDLIVDEIEVSNTVRAFLAENMKEICGQVIIHLDKIKEENGFQVWKPFSKENITFKLTSPLEQALS
jgi:hypothetical protein